MNRNRKDVLGISDTAPYRKTLNPIFSLIPKTGGIMNLKNMTIALMISSGYAILLKLSHLFIPSLFHISSIPGITQMLSLIVGVIIILFLFLFYAEEKSNTKLETVLKILLGCFILNFLLRLPVIQGMIGFKAVRMTREIIGFVNAVLLFALLIIYKQGLPAGRQPIKQAADFVTVMFGIGVIKSLSSLITFTRFVLFGTEAVFPPAFYNIMFILFLFTHASIIYFLYHYYKFKFTEK